MTANDDSRKQAAEDFAKVARPLRQVRAAWNRRLKSSGGLKPTPSSIVQQAHDLDVAKSTGALSHRLSTGTLAQLVHVAAHADAVAGAVEAIEPMTMRTLARSAIETSARLNWQFQELTGPSDLLRRTGSLWLTETGNRRKLAAYSEAAVAAIDGEREILLEACAHHRWEPRRNKKGKELDDLEGAAVPSATEMVRDVDLMGGIGDTIYRLYSGTSHGWPTALQEHAIDFDRAQGTMTVQANLHQATLTVATTTSFFGRVTCRVVDAHGLDAGPLTRAVREAEQTLNGYLQELSRLGQD